MGTLSNNYGEKIGNESFCFISSLLPSSSSETQTSKAVCYEVECDSTNKNIIVKIGSESIKCPTEGNEAYTPSGFKGSIVCPKYEDICDFTDDKICNGIFTCLDNFAANDDYKASYCDFEGNETYCFVKDDDDDSITPITTDKSERNKLNLILLVISFIIFLL